MYGKLTLLPFNDTNARKAHKPFSVLGADVNECVHSWNIITPFMLIYFFTWLLYHKYNALDSLHFPVLNMQLKYNYIAVVDFLI